MICELITSIINNEYEISNKDIKIIYSITKFIDLTRCILLRKLLGNGGKLPNPLEIIY